MVAFGAKYMNFPLFQSHAAGQLPHFPSLWPTSLTSILEPTSLYIHICDTIFKQVEDDVGTSKFFLGQYITFLD
jgi:hypothetical protein